MISFQLDLTLTLVRDCSPGLVFLTSDLGVVLETPVL